MGKQSDQRRERLMPGGIPRWIRCYDNGGRTADRYTIVFTNKSGGFTFYSSENPFWPQGVGQHEDGRVDSALIWGGDKEWAAHLRKTLGPRVKFTDLPDRVREAVLIDYTAAWSL